MYCPVLHRTVKMYCSPDDRLSHPPYAVNNQNSHLPLGWQTLPPSALHYGGVTHYDAHNLYGLAEAKVMADRPSTIKTHIKTLRLTHTSTVL